jgi:uracil-DNA glycosylase
MKTSQALKLSQLMDAVFRCRRCPTAYGFLSKTPDEPYFKFPPIIGKTYDAKLLFVGINPRISGRGPNWLLHCALMRDKSNFLSLSENVVDKKPYIALNNGQEGHYLAHARLVEMLFGPDCNFEEVAAVTEIFLCATKDSTFLPNPESQCADLYFGDTVLLTNPQVIVAVGERVMRYFNILPNKQWVQDHMVLKFENRDIPVVKMPHPGNPKLTEFEKNEGLAETAKRIREIWQSADLRAASEI